MFCVKWWFCHRCLQYELSFPVQRTAEAVVLKPHPIPVPVGISFSLEEAGGIFISHVGCANTHKTSGIFITVPQGPRLGREIHHNRIINDRLWWDCKPDFLTTSLNPLPLGWLLTHYDGVSFKVEKCQLSILVQKIKWHNLKHAFVRYYVLYSMP